MIFHPHDVSCHYIKAHATASSDGGDRAAVDVSKLPFSRQLLTPHFMFIALWSFVSSTRILFLLGTVEGQAEYNGGGRSSAQAKELVGWFNILLMVANVLTPLFGLLLDKYGIAVGLLLVNVMVRGKGASGGRCALRVVTWMVERTAW